MHVRMHTCMHTHTHTHTQHLLLGFIYLPCFSFTAYMKLYQLEMKGKQIPGYDCILVDEAQDLTPGIYAE